MTVIPVYVDYIDYHIVAYLQHATIMSTSISPAIDDILITIGVRS